MIPIWLKLAYTLFVCALVPIYWRQYGPANFLWFSDVALSYFFSNPRDNVNWVYGLSERPRTMVAGWLFVLFLMLMFPLVIYLPMHLLFDRVFGPGH